MNHFHITIDEPGSSTPGGRKKGALCTSRSSAESEKRIEEEGNRKVDIEECSQACFGQSPFIQKQHA